MNLHCNMRLQFFIYVSCEKIIFLKLPQENDPRWLISMTNSHYYDARIYVLRVRATRGVVFWHNTGFY